MTDFFSSLKADLLDRRVLPVLVVLGVALLGAVAFAVLGGGGSTSAPAPLGSAAVPVATGPSGLAISQAVPSTSQAVAETTSGTSQQHGGLSRDPFSPLPGSQPAASSNTQTASKTKTPSTTSGSSAAGGAGTTPAPTPKSTALTPPLTYIHFHVTAQFGVVPAPVAGSPPRAPKLKTYKNMAQYEPLPEKGNAQLVFIGVELSTGKEAAFVLPAAATVYGSATCKPSPKRCQAIVLHAGRSEKLEVLGPNGQPVMYELKLLSISRTASPATTARANDPALAESKAGRELLLRAGRLTVPGLRYSPGKGVLLFAAPAGA